MRALSLVVLSLWLAVFPAAAAVGGKYAGTWSGASGAGGDLKMSFTSGADGKWTAEVSFTFAGETVPCKVKSVSVDGDKVEVVYEFDLGGVQLQSTATGQLSGNKMEGKYTTKSVADGSTADQGAWSATAAK